MTYEILDDHDVLNSYHDINEYTINLKEVNEQYIVFDFKLKHNIKRAAVVHLNYKLKNGGWLKDEFEHDEFMTGILQLPIHTDLVSYKDIDPDNIFAAVEFDDIKLIQRYMIYNRTGNKKEPFSLLMTTESKILAEGMMFNEVNYTGYRHIIRAQKHINEYIIEMNNIKVKKENKNVRNN